MRINVDAKTATVVTLEDFDRAALQAKAKLPRALSPISFILVNHADQDIVALRVIWKAPNPQTGRN